MLWSAMDHLPGFVSLSLMFADLLQVPLVLAIVYSIRLSRRFGRAWKGIGLSFGAYAAWVILLGLTMGFSASMYLVVALGVLIDPSHSAAPSWRTMTLGSTAVALLFWILPTGIAWLSRRKRISETAPPPTRLSWRWPAACGILLLGAQQLFFLGTGDLTAQEAAKPFD